MNIDKIGALKAIGIGFSLDDFGAGNSLLCYQGVETEGQREFLARIGCHANQGYLFSRPVPIDAFDSFAMRQP